MNELSVNLEDYLETIFNLIESGKQAQVSEIADTMGVSRPSVTQIISKLADMGYVEHEPYRDVTLTPKGIRTARCVARKHQLFREFLTEILGVPDEIAEAEACKLEHAIGTVTTERFSAFVEFTSRDNNPPDWLEKFHDNWKKEI
ncbi:MAG: metal-dependent transcriptional regulator [bacterium]